MLDDVVSEKDEFLILIRYMEKMMRVNPTMLFSSPDYAQKVSRFNSLVTLVPSFNLSKEESSEVQSLWNSLKVHINKRTLEVLERGKLTPQELLLKTLRDIVCKWEDSSRDEKKLLISEVNELSLNQVVFVNMTSEQMKEYNELLGTIKSLASVEQVSLEEYRKLENIERRRLGL